MILYFSATGNCKYVAARLAAAFGQETVSIVDCIQGGAYYFTDDTIGIVVPTYFWGLPSIVKEFLEKADFHTDYLYFISTYGTTPGASDAMASRAIRGRKIDAFYSVRMPDTWTPIFDLSTPEKVAAFSKTTEAEIDAAIRKIGERHTNRHMDRTFLHFWRSGSHNRVTTTINGERRIFVWRKAASAADCAQRNVRFRPSRCERESRYGSRRNAPCVLAACTAAPSLPSSMGRTPNGTGSIRIPMSRCSLWRVPP